MSWPTALWKKWLGSSAFFERGQAGTLKGMLEEFFPFAAEGDVITVDADGNPIRIPVGSDGEFLMADSSVDGGLTYGSASALTNLDGGSPESVYGGVTGIDGGGP